MIKGIGIDIIEIERIDRAIKNTKSFLEKVFSDKEIDFFYSKKLKVESIAGNFAAKEAVSKALGTGIRGFNLKDIEVLRNELGAPIVNLHNNAKVLALKLHVRKIHVSISHNKSSAIAYVLLEGI